MVRPTQPSRIPHRAVYLWLRPSVLVAMSAGLLLFVDAVRSDEASVPIAVRSEIDREVPSFYVRAVTGPLAGKSVCYVCRNGDRPVVMVLLRELGPDPTALLKELDQTVNRHRADGLRCFAVLLTGTPQREAPRLQTLAFDEKLDLPLTIAGEAIASDAALNVDPDSAVTVLLYENRRVVSRFAHRSGTCDETARREIVSAAEKLATSNRD